MKKNKAILLLKLLNKTELIAFTDFLKAHKRKSLYRLYTAISSESDMIPDEVFQAVFNRKYSKKENYLLRNEFRLLSNELLRFVSRSVADTQSDDTSRQLKLYLHFLLSRNAFDLFESETNHALKEAQKKEDYPLVIYLIEQYTSYIKWHREATSNTYQNSLTLVDETLDVLKKNFSRQFNSLWLERIFVQRTLMAIDPNQKITSFSPPDLDWEHLSKQDNYLAFTNELIQAAELSGELKIKKLLDAITKIKGIIKPGFDHDLEEAKLNASIALEYFLLAEYQNSLQFHKKVISQEDKIPREQFIPFLFNYLSTLLRVKDYELSITIINKHGQHWLNNPRLKDRTLCMKAMCHIFLNQPEEAFACIPSGLKESGIDHYYYYRVILIVIYYLRQEFELALTEADNFLHSLHYQSHDDDYKKLVLVMKRFFKAEQDKNVLRNDQYLKQLTSSDKSLKEFLSSRPNPHNALLYSWLQYVIKVQIS